MRSEHPPPMRSADFLAPSSCNLAFFYSSPSKFVSSPSDQTGSSISQISRRGVLVLCACTTPRPSCLCWPAGTPSLALQRVLASIRRQSVLCSHRQVVSVLLGLLLRRYNFAGSVRRRGSPFNFLYSSPFNFVRCGIGLIARSKVDCLVLF